MIDLRNQLRHMGRKRRRHLSTQEQDAAANKVEELVCNHHFYQRVKRVAFYHANDGELDPSPLLEKSLEMGKECYLPALNPVASFSMYFLRYQPGDKLVPNQYGILEPVFDAFKVCPPQKLDLVFTPLVRFDLLGNRLGMGAGFYDRCFSFLKKGPRSTYLLGLGYDFQQTLSITPEPWDIPLDGVATDKKLFFFNRILRDQL